MIGTVLSNIFQKRCQGSILTLYLMTPDNVNNCIDQHFLKVWFAKFQGYLKLLIIPIRCEDLTEASHMFNVLASLVASPVSVKCNFIEKYLMLFNLDAN